ncbi:MULTISPECIES: hypothetical protein [unclassified Kitasatospora]
MIVITDEPFAFFMIAAMAGVIFCAVFLGVVAIIWGRGGDDE